MSCVAIDTAADILSTVLPASASPVEGLRGADFAMLTAEEARDARKMLQALRPALPLRLPIIDH